MMKTRYMYLQLLLGSYAAAQSTPTSASSTSAASLQTSKASLDLSVDGSLVYFL